jgi:hypothetical protein
MLELGVTFPNMLMVDAAFTVGSIIAIIVLLLCILGALGVLPGSPVVVFGLIGALAVARLV